MKEYLKLFPNGFDETVPSRRAIENWPFVGHDVVSGEIVYTEISKPATGPADNEIWYTSTDGNVVDPYKTDGFGANIVSNTYEDGKGVITFDRPVTSIGYHVFRYCSSLTSVTIPNSVTSIGDLAFESCSLTSVTIPDRVTRIGIGAFSNCYSLISITIPNSVKSIGKSAFSGCPKLTSITIPNSVTSIGYRAFYNCGGLTKTNYTGDIAGWCNIKFDNDFDANPISRSYNFYINDQEIKDLVIPNSVLTINDYAFCNCFGLTSISIPNSVTTIGSYAFRNCRSIPSVTIPDSTTSIGEGAFQYCLDLTSITYEGTIEQWNAITKGASWNNAVPATYVQCTDGQVTL